jgi:LysR family transcriptional regulator, regulator for metE and metH
MAEFMLEIRHLKTLIALRDTGSLVEAAERVFLTQSALSHQIKEIESRFECPLFVRKTRPLRFSEAGKRLLVLAEDVIARVDAAERDIKKLVHGDAGRLFMAIECHSCFNWLMPMIDIYRGYWPAVELDFSSGFTFEPLPALAKGDIDLVITSDPQEIKGIDYLPIFSYEMQIALAKNHELLEKEFLLPEDFKNQTLITYPVARSRLDIFNRFLTPANVEPAKVRSSELTLMMVQLVASGLGVCALPNWVLQEYVDKDLIQMRRAGKEGIWPVLYTAIRQEDAHLAYVKDFLQLAKKYCLEKLTRVKQVV